MNQRAITLAAMAITASATTSLYAKSIDPARPNILLITCEDINPYLGCYGDSVAKSPNLDRFAEEGVRFSQMHTTVGVSAPSRFALISGMYPSAMGANYMRTFVKKLEQYPVGLKPYYVILPDEVKGYTEYLREAGYYCTNAGKTDYQFNVPLSLWDENGGKAHWRNSPDGMPFFAMFNIMITHESNVWNQGEKPLLVDPADVEVPPYYPDNDVVRHDIAVMYSNVARMDSQFQAMVDQLKEEGVYDNTIIIWISDNGGPLPRQKRAIYESGTHVPAIIRFPDGYKAGTVDDRLAMFVDVPATILSLAGVKPPKYMHGEALYGKYAAKNERKYIYAARDRMDEQYDKQGAVSDGRFRYVRNYDLDHSNYTPVGYRFNMPLMLNILELKEAGKLNEAQSLWFSEDRGAEEFYDDLEDPHSVNNLIDDPRYSEKIAELRKEFDRWVDKYNSRWLLSEVESRELMLPNNGDQPTLNAPTIAEKKGRVVLSSDNKGASIVYRINGKSHTEEGWYLYSQPIEGIKSGDIITAVAARAGYAESKVAKYVCE
ncbi:MAG: sulfatase-like hydrolase/transferase [Rikenellaceae bacterium]